jgi:hypothetical protein
LFGLAESAKFRQLIAICLQPLTEGGGIHLKSHFASALLPQEKRCLNGLPLNKLASRHEAD